MRARLHRLIASMACGALAAGGFAAVPAASSESPSSYELYARGEAQNALIQAHADLKVALETGTPSQRWQHMMHVAWLEESIGNHEAAFRLAERALVVASQDGNPFRVGRSLCWLGWSATSLGLYPLALEFYDAAIEQATDGNGGNQIPAVWGLATQEKGAVLAKMGELEAGAALIEETTEFARRNNIDVGVAEGGAHLARIALRRGDWVEAAARAEEALIAAEKCHCSAFNTNRARLVKARVVLERSRIDPRYTSEAEAQIRAALAEAERVSDRRHVAEAQLLLSRAIGDRDLESRIALVSAAAETLHSLGSELRGSADGELGALMLASDRPDLAGIYLESGLQINRELLRKLDAAYILGDLAEIDLAANDSTAYLEKWMKSADQAEASGAWPLAAESQERIAEELYRRGFLSLSRHWSEKAAATIERMLEKSDDAGRRRELQWRKLALDERIVGIEIELDHSPAPPSEKAEPASAPGTTE
jgi:tetratricopeptide (TPR) repeat protein